MGIQKFAGWMRKAASGRHCLGYQFLIQNRKKAMLKEKRLES